MTLIRKLTSVAGGLLVAALFTSCTTPTTVPVNSSTLTGKVMVGYQGWFNAEGDGAKRGYNHWTRGTVMPAISRARASVLKACGVPR